MASQIPAAALPKQGDITPGSTAVPRPQAAAASAAVPQTGTASSTVGVAQPASVNPAVASTGSSGAAAANAPTTPGVTATAATAATTPPAAATQNPAAAAAGPVKATAAAAPGPVDPKAGNPAPASAPSVPPVAVAPDGRSATAPVGASAAAVKQLAETSSPTQKEVGARRKSVDQAGGSTNSPAPTSRKAKPAVADASDDDDITEDIEEDIDYEESGKSSGKTSRTDSMRDSKPAGKSPAPHRKSRLSNSEGRNDSSGKGLDFASRLAGGIDNATADLRDEPEYSEDYEEEEVQQRHPSGSGSKRGKSQQQRTAAATDDESPEGVKAGKGRRTVDRKRASTDDDTEGTPAEDAPRSGRGRKSAADAARRRGTSDDDTEASAGGKAKAAKSKSRHMEDDESGPETPKQGKGKGSKHAEQRRGTSDDDTEEPTADEREKGSRSAGKDKRPIGRLQHPESDGEDSSERDVGRKGRGTPKSGKDAARRQAPADDETEEEDYRADRGSGKKGKQSASKDKTPTRKLQHVESDEEDSTDRDVRRKGKGTPKSGSGRKGGASQRPEFESEEEEDTRGDNDAFKARRKVSGSSKGRSEQQEQQRAPYRGDVSAWHAEEEDDSSEVATEMMSMSSGLSPRQPREQPFDYKQAKEALAYNAGQFGRAQAMRREGNAPAAVGIADDLPTRMAYAQLDVLAGMAGKVQDAIMHNKRIFEHRMQIDQRLVLKRVFDGWRAARYGNIAKQQKLRRAVNRIQRGLLTRAFQQWMDMVGTRDAGSALLRKVAGVIRRGMLRRTLREWSRIAKERHWKVEFEMREQEIMRLENRVRIYKRRPIYVMRNRKLRSILWMWWALSEKRRSRRLRMAKAVKHFANRELAKAWNTWMDNHQEAKRHKGLLNKAVGKMRNIKLSGAWEKWMDYVGEKHAKDSKMRKALAFLSNLQMAKAWNAWTEYTRWRKEKKRMIRRWMQPHMARAFEGWCDFTQWKKRMAVILHRAGRRLALRNLSMAWDAWVAMVEEKGLASQDAERGDAMTRLQELEAENNRLRRDNERFVRLIDSGEWGRGRVAELVAAGEVLKGERDALHKLITSLRREYEAVVSAKHNQEDELRQMKDRMLLGGASRNRMLVKGGSSFNALVRAMKQDLVDGAAAQAAPGQQDPNLLYEIDKLSMDHVQVFPDGGLHIQAVASTPTAAGLAHSTTAVAKSSTSPPRHGRASPSRAAPAVPPARRSMTSHPTKPMTGPGAYSQPSQATQRVLSALRSLTPAEVDRLQMALPQAQSTGPAGPASTAPTRRSQH